METVSIIVPVYNVKEYLEECLTSILDQTYPQLEILLVDDGSTDGSTDICQTYQKSDASIRYIRQENQGLSGARNTGLRMMTGEWVCFVDSDDWLDRHYVETLLEEAYRTQADVVACSYYLASDLATVAVKLPAYHSESKKQLMTDYFTKEALKTIVWNKLYRSSLLEGLRFELGKLHEDEFFTFRLLDRVSSGVQIPEPLYFYRQREDSIMSTAFSVRNISSLEAHVSKVAYVNCELPELSLGMKMAGYSLALYQFQRTYTLKDKDMRKKAQVQILELSEAFLMSGEEYRGLKVRDKIKYLLVCYFMKPYAKTRCWLKLGV